jgi:hypothetical protein
MLANIFKETPPESVVYHSEEKEPNVVRKEVVIK